MLLILPGSRPGEIARILPPFGDAAMRLKREHPTLRLVLPIAGVVAAPVRAAVAAWPHPPLLVEDEAGKLDAMAAATVALACSGSVTTELALAGCPMVVGYRVGPLTHLVLRRLITTRFITLFNIAAGRAVAPELVQQACTGETLATALAARLDDPAMCATQVVDQFAALDAMGRDPTLIPAERAADAVIQVLRASGKL